MVYTDNNLLSLLTSAKLGLQSSAGQHNSLACFDFEVKYRPGRCNKNTVALSHQNPPVELPVAFCALMVVLPSVLQCEVLKGLHQELEFCYPTQGRRVPKNLWVSIQVRAS